MSGSDQNHPGMVENVVLELAIRGKTRVVLVVDVIAADFVTALISPLAMAARFDITAIRQKFVTDVTVAGDPQTA